MTGLKLWRIVIVHIVFLDLAKAFDSVSHPQLLLKLEALGITGELLNWFKAFLTE